MTELYLKKLYPLLVVLALLVEIYLKDQNGCKWHISGDISYSLFPPSISSFDIDINVGDCYRNNWTFTGGAAPNESFPYNYFAKSERTIILM